MDVSGVVTSIANLGFPAVCCVLMIWLNHEQSKVHKEELQAMREALNHNTEALKELKCYIYSERKEHDAARD